MGAGCGSSARAGDPQPEEVVRTRSSRPAAKEEETTSWERLEGKELEEPLRKGWLSLVRADWIVELADAGGTLQRLQELPPKAFISVDELRKAGSAALNSRTVVDGEWLRIIVLSYPWLQKSHPDPFGESLRLIAKALKHYTRDSKGYDNGGKPYGVLIDFTALPQVPRTKEENEVFKLGLSALNLFYSHPQTVVLKVTTLPDGFPNNAQYVEPNAAAYAERGWCFAESAMSGLVKNSNQVLDVSHLRGEDKLCDAIHHCRSGRAPPLHPAKFQVELDMKAFTSKKDDFEKVRKLYADAFERRLGDARELDYSGLGWDAVAARRLVHALKDNGALESLNLQSNRIGVMGAAELGQALKDHRALQSLNLAENDIGVEGVAVLVGEALKDNTTLQSLNLNKNNVRAEGAAALGEALQANRALQSLELAGNGIGDTGAIVLAEALKRNRTLTSLVLAVNLIGVEGTAALGKALAENKSLQSLSLEENSAGADGAVALRRVLKDGPLNRLNLKRNDIGDKGAAGLGQALRQSLCLQSLNLESNCIGADGADALGQGLEGNAALQSLFLRSNDIGDKGAVALGQALKQHPVLQTLDLWSNRIGAEGATALGEALKDNTAVTSLTLGFNNVGDEGAAALGQALRTNTALRSLSLQSNSIRDEGAAALGQALKDNEGLVWLDLLNNDISADNKAELFKVAVTRSSRKGKQLTIKLPDGNPSREKY